MSTSDGLVSQDVGVIEKTGVGVVVLKQTGEFIQKLNYFLKQIFD